ncbi:hypothetical protein HPB49_004707 [Dermacentor silvarum]|uniref:Uncharacterized protein n=1 Tax=Dermacentor silvarum TaxID=543639 RepID=A0ACB8DAW2_DERSI|nr:hypothetical protein HPB49_004707 [Dermacentor silvarum]
MTCRPSTSPLKSCLLLIDCSATELPLPLENGASERCITTTVQVDRAVQVSSLFSVSAMDKRKWRRKERDLNARIERLKNTVDKYKQELQKLKEECYVSAFLQVVEKAKEKDLAASILVEQVQNFAKKQTWSEETVRHAVVLRNLSTRAYEHVRSTGILRLPCRSTLEIFMGSSRGEVGMTELVKQRLSAELASHPSLHARACSLIVDQMCVKQRLLYHKQRDAFIGEVDYGVNFPKETTNEPVLANSLLCFVLNGLPVSFKIPVAYFFARNCTGRELHRLMRHVLKEVEEIGFFVVRIVTDNHKINVLAMQLLCNGSLKHCIDHPGKPNRKLFLAFDQCHLIKNVRSQFLSRDIGKRRRNISEPLEEPLQNAARQPCKASTIFDEKARIPYEYGKNERAESSASFFSSHDSCYEALARAGGPHVRRKLRGCRTDGAIYELRAPLVRAHGRLSPRSPRRHHPPHSTHANVDKDPAGPACQAFPKGTTRWFSELEEAYNYNKKRSYRCEPRYKLHSEPHCLWRREYEYARNRTSPWSVPRTLTWPNSFATFRRSCSVASHIKSLPLPFGKNGAYLYTFEGRRVPSYVYFQGVEFRCRPFRPVTQVCHCCLRTGHRHDICPYLQERRCGNCGVLNPDEHHERCLPRCLTCGSDDHPTIDLGCPARQRGLGPRVVKEECQDPKRQNTTSPRRDTKQPPTTRSCSVRCEKRGHVASTPATRTHPTTWLGGKRGANEFIQFDNRREPGSIPTASATAGPLADATKAWSEDNGPVLGYGDHLALSDDNARQARPILRRQPSVEIQAFHRAMRKKYIKSDMYAPHRT